MPRLLVLALALFSLTLVVPLFVWAISRSWRAAMSAWWDYGRYMLALYAVGGLTWLGMVIS